MSGRRPAPEPLEGEGLIAPCRFKSVQTMQDAGTEFLTRFGDGPPPKAIKDAVTEENLARWVMYCAPEDPGEIVAAMRYEPNDWYLCTLKNAAVAPALRGKRIANRVYRETADLAEADPGCAVLAADVTADNIPSVKALKNAGFVPVGRFCWKKGEKPTDVWHFVRQQPDGQNQCRN